MRHVGLIREPTLVRPYVQILNTSAWLLYEHDFDPAFSSVELAAYLLVHGDRMALTGEVTRAAIYNAAYWFDRTDAECGSFADGAERSDRPDAEAFRDLAEATPWLRQLSHETLRPPALAPGYRPIPGTGLLVRRDLEEKPPALVNRWVGVATRTVAQFVAGLQPAAPKTIASLCDWLATEHPPLLVSGQRDRILWDPATPQRIGTLRSQLRTTTAQALADIGKDLDVVATRTRAFHDALLAADALPAPDPDTEHRGYAYLHRQRGLITYNLHEAGLERLQSPAIPYARGMLGARTIHEWCHLAVDAGWVPLTAEHADYVAAIGRLANCLDEVVAAAPMAIRQRTAANLHDLIATSPEPDAHGLVELTRHLEPSPGLALACIILRRMPDYQANLLAQRFLTMAERETYVRQNVRELRSEYSPQRLWSMLARYLYEYQYLTFSEVADPQEYFLRSTWFDTDFIATRILDERRFSQLAALVAALCQGFAVNEDRFKPVAARE